MHGNTAYLSVLNNENQYMRPPSDLHAVQDSYYLANVSTCEHFQQSLQVPGTDLEPKLAQQENILSQDNKNETGLLSGDSYSDRNALYNTFALK